MCGIAGLWNVTSGAPAERIDLDRMVRALHHRGPDDHGIHLAGPLGIGHTRLSIVDLSGGHQPMCNEDGSIWVVFNGEIYNHKELRAGLIAKGHRFATHSDTEVILHQYEEVGERCVESFNGQFAFALWDAKRHRLLLARDRLGVRPLYYVWSRDGIRFASEIKALFTDPSIPRALDPIALDQIFTFWFPLPPRTGFVGVSEVPPGHTLTIHHGGSTLRRYWGMEFPAEETGRQPRHPERWYRDRLGELLDDAVALRLRADVPVGAYVSGGLDSSVVAAMARRKVNDRLLTFSIGFEAAEFDERSFQSAVVDHLGTQHTACVYRTLDIGREFPAAMWHMERPVLRTAPVPMMRLAQGVRAAGIKVVLTGEGADEVLAGYDIFKEAKVRRFWAQSPDSRFRPLLLRRLYPYLSGVQGQASAYLKGFFGQGLEDTSDPFYSHRPRWQVAAQIKSLLAVHVREGLAEYDAVEELRDQLPDAFSTWHPLSQAQYLEAAYLLPGYILSSQGDRMAMAHSVEGRFPFLDHRLVEFAATIPPQFKLKRLREKHLLREVASDLLPSVVIDRDKQPYRAPDHAAFFQDGRPLEYVEAALSPEAVEAAGTFATGPVSGLLAKCRRSGTLGTRDGMALVGALSVQLLHRQFVERPVGAEVSPHPSEAS